MIKIEFSGSGDEVREEMLKLLGLQGSRTDSGKRLPDEENSEAENAAGMLGRGRKRGRGAAIKPNAWTEEEAQELIEQIRPNARKIMLELAVRPKGYKRSDLATALGVSQQSIRGQLSSVGSALRRMGGKTSPIVRRKIDGEFIYGLNPTVADIVTRYQTKQ